ncbi:unnamed protein product [Peronospora farinosa]|uniref:Uncharacterized protein n=1 Tax=Peronospora farinosa TaxID=134698 RepID=A0ABN8CG12_9STRA|nr:unnamed protein product [Peronospora farinosa]
MLFSFINRGQPALQRDFFPGEMPARGTHQYHVGTQGAVKLQRLTQFSRITVRHQHRDPAVMRTRHGIANKQIGQPQRRGVEIAATARCVSWRWQQMEIPEVRLLLRKGVIRLSKTADGSQRSAMAVKCAAEALLDQRRTGRGFMPVGEIVADYAAGIGHDFMIERIFYAANQQIAARVTQHKAMHHQVINGIFHRKFRG